MAPHLTRAVLALDPGGSKCDAVLAAEDGTVVGWGRVQHPGLSGRSALLIKAAATRAIGQYTFDELHVAAFCDTLPAGIIGPGSTVCVRMWPLTETEGALALVGQKYGIVVLSGTGARVSAHTRDGQELALDGLGPLLGDRGSGYSIGLHALRAAALGFSHLRHQSSLRHRIFTAFDEIMSRHAESPPVNPANTRGCAAGVLGGRADDKRLMERTVHFSLAPQDRSAVASLAKIVNEEAEAGDAVATRILKDAAAAIAETLRDLVDRLQIANDEYILAGTGSVVGNSDIFWNHLCGLVGGMAPRFTMIRSPMAPVLGNAAYVLGELSPHAIDSVHTRLFESKLPENSSL